MGNRMNDSEYNELRAESWRRELTPAEESRARAYWASHPGAQADWEEDLVLTRQLRELPDAPISSNFTSLVLQAVDAEDRVSTEAIPVPLYSKWIAWIHRFAPRIAVAALVAALATTAFFKHQHHNRQQVAGDVRAFLYVTTLPGPEVFEDFDAIQQLKPVALSSAVSTTTDDDLLAALQ